MNLMQTITVWKITRLEKRIKGYDKFIAKLRTWKKNDKRAIRELESMLRWNKIS